MPLPTSAETETAKRLDRKARKQRAKRLANRKHNGSGGETGSEIPTVEIVAKDETGSPSNSRKQKIFNPIVTSLRGIQQASELKKVQKKLGRSRASLGSLSEATSVFNPESLVSGNDSIPFLWCPCPLRTLYPDALNGIMQS